MEFHENRTKELNITVLAILVALWQVFSRSGAAKVRGLLCSFTEVGGPLRHYKSHKTNSQQVPTRGGWLVAMSAIVSLWIVKWIPKSL